MSKNNKSKHSEQSPIVSGSFFYLEMSKLIRTFIISMYYFCFTYKK